MVLYGIYQKNWMIGRPFTTKEDAIAKWNNYKYLFSEPEVRQFEADNQGNITKHK